MIEQNVEIRTPDGVAEAVFLRPEADLQLPGALHFTDIGGIRTAHIAMAKQLADAGYAVLVPNLFYRNAHPPTFVRIPNEPMEDMRRRIAALAAPLTPEAVARDASAFVDYLVHAEGVRQDQPFGVVGYCIAGAIAMRTVAARPDKIAACASFHGGGLFTPSPASPHLLLPRIHARLYFGHAVEDPSMNAEQIAGLEQALAAWGGEYASETYAGAFHSWTSPDSPVYNPQQAARAFGKLTELFAARG